MTYTAWQTFIEGADGLPVSGASIEVRVEASGSLATIYSDKDGAALANPFTTGTDGLARFYAAAGFYKITASLGAYSASFRFQPIGQAQGYDVGTSSGQIPTIALADVRYNPNLNHNLTATGAPTVNDDDTAGYEIQSVWVDVSVSPDQRYICLDNTTGAAVWVEVYSTVGGTSADLITYNNATSGLAATDVQDAVDEIQAQITDETLPFTAATGGTIAATDVSGAINELDADIQALPTLAAGTWTTTLTTGTNISSVTAGAGYYSMVGNIVTCSVYVSIDPTSTGAFDFKMTVPVASNFTSVTDVCGHGVQYETARFNCVVQASPSDDKLYVSAVAKSGSLGGVFFTIQYIVK